MFVALQFKYVEQYLKQMKKNKRKLLFIEKVEKYIDKLESKAMSNIQEDNT